MYDEHGLVRASISFRYCKADQHDYTSYLSFKDGGAFETVEVMGRYKYYASFENDYCADYVTEKIQHSYSMGVVPILDGSKDYSCFLPTNHSSLRLDDFATSKQLAHRILGLDQHDAAYMKYLDYKESTTPFESLLHPMLLDAFDVSQGK